MERPTDFSAAGDEPARFARVRELYERALGLSPEDREALLESATDDVSLREEVAGLLAKGPAPTRFLVTTSRQTRFAPGTADPAQIGPYRITRRVGQGGMGMVYEAEQDEPRRRVAIKILRPEFVNAEMKRRFELEAQALAVLDHPAIVPLFEFGRTTNGQRFLALEYVDGVPFDEFVARHALSRTERLRLFLELCRGVAYAHFSGVMHRDLKPSNVLVVEESWTQRSSATRKNGDAAEGEATSREESGGTSRSGSRGLAAGRVRILDFGLARFFGESFTDDGPTLAGDLRGTVAYMSPEQAAGRSEGIDTRTDVYSLGVILYETLLSQRPHDLGGLSLVDALKCVADQPATRPRAVDRRLPGDLDAILRKALANEPDERYPSAAALADDLERFLEGFPVVARPPSVLYLASKLARRHRAATAAAISIVTVISTSVGVFVWQQHRSNRVIAKERDKAIEEFQLREALLDFLTQLLHVGRPSGMGADTSVVQALRQVADQAFDRYAGMPALASPVHSYIAVVFGEFGLFRDSIRHHQRALEATNEVYGPDHPESIRAAVNLARVLALDRQLESADAVFAGVVARARGVVPENRSLTGYVLTVQAEIEFRRDDPRAALASVDEALDLLAVGVNDEALRLAHLIQASALSELGRHGPSERIARSELAAATRAHGSTHASTAQALEVLMSACLRAGRTEEVERLREAHADTFRALSLRVGQPSAWYLWESYAGALWQRGKLEEAEAIQRQLLGAREAVLMAEHPDTRSTAQSLAVTLVDEQRLDEGVALLEAYFPDLDQDLERGDPDAYTALTTYANIDGQRGRYDLAEEKYRRVVSFRSRRLGPWSPSTVKSRQDRAVCLAQLGRHQEAIEEYRDLLEPRWLFGPDLSEEQRWLMRGNLSQCLLFAGDVEEAERLTIELLDDIPASMGEDHPDVYSVRLGLLKVLNVRGSWHEALRLGVRLCDEGDRARQGSRCVASGELARALAGLGKYDEARQITEQVLKEVETDIGPGSGPALLVRRDLVLLALRSGDLGAEQDVDSLWTEASRLFGARDVRTAPFHSMRADWLMAAERWADAEAALREMMEILEAQANEQNGPNARHGRRSLVECLRQLDREEEADELSAQWELEAEAPRGSDFER